MSYTLERLTEVPVWLHALVPRLAEDVSFGLNGGLGIGILGNDSEGAGNRITD